jgi:uncharacterized glyoxalase superfamily protein PhnB
MSVSSDPQRQPSVTSSLSYRDAPAAIEWLCRAFGFEAKLVVPGDAPGTVAHSELVLGRGMVMVGSARPAAEPGRRWQRAPGDPDGPQACLYVYVPDVDAHAQRAVAAGARIVSALADRSHGGRDYGCEDLEGHVWYFGSYDPWAPRG